MQGSPPLEGAGPRRQELRRGRCRAGFLRAALGRAALERELRSLNYEAGFEHLDLAAEEFADCSEGLENASVEIILGQFDEAWADPEVIDDEKL